MYLGSAKQHARFGDRCDGDIARTVEHTAELFIATEVESHRRQGRRLAAGRAQYIVHHGGLAPASRHYARKDTLKQTHTLIGDTSPQTRRSTLAAESRDEVEHALLEVFRRVG